VGSEPELGTPVFGCHVDEWDVDHHCEGRGRVLEIGVGMCRLCFWLDSRGRRERAIPWNKTQSWPRTKNWRRDLSR
jgi:hypothetical protein